jgi:hypothetical protein
MLDITATAEAEAARRATERALMKCIVVEVCDKLLFKSPLKFSVGVKKVLRFYSSRLLLLALVGNDGKGRNIGFLL